MASYDSQGLPVEDFIQALTSQLDRAQATMRVKARFGLPLTFAVKEISLDLRTHLSMQRNQILLHPAGPDDRDASVIHLSLTTITRPMIEENTFEFEPEDAPINTILTDELDEEEQRRLEWAGIRTVSQLRDLQKSGGEQIIGQVAQIPAVRLRQALRRASQPHISQVGRANDGRIRIRGLNLIKDDDPEVRIDGELATVEHASDKELIVMPLGHHDGEVLEVKTAPDNVIVHTLDQTMQVWDSPTNNHDYVQNGWHDDHYSNDG